MDVAPIDAATATATLTATAIVPPPYLATATAPAAATAARSAIASDALATPIASSSRATAKRNAESVFPVEAE